MFCPTCGAVLPDDARFCAGCGMVIIGARPAPAAARPESRDPYASAPVQAPPVSGDPSVPSAAPVEAWPAGGDPYAPAPAETPPVIYDRYGSPVAAPTAVKVKSRAFTPKSLVSMILGIGALIAMTVAFILVIMAIIGYVRLGHGDLSGAHKPFLNSMRGIIVAGVGLPHGIVAAVLSSKSADVSGNGRVFRRVGKITGTIAFIGCAVFLALSILFLILSMNWLNPNPYYHGFGDLYY